MTGYIFKCDNCGKEAHIDHYDLNEAIDIIRAHGWLIRGVNQTGPDDCQQCKAALESACRRKIRGDGSFE